jgi:cobalamin-dependent methionine synthase I
MRLAIAEHQKERVVLEDGTVLSSISLARLLRHSTAVAIMGATVGPDIVEAAVGAVANGDGATAVIHDAVGGQTADAAMSWINDFIRQQLRRQGEHLTKHRFSPGYGDLQLQIQKTIHRWLRLERLGLSLTPGCMLVPEKSVTALAGIERTVMVEERHDT